MEAVREIIDINKTEILLKIPNIFLGQKVEIIILPYGKKMMNNKAHVEKMPIRKCGKIYNRLTRDEIYDNER